MTKHLVFTDSEITWQWPGPKFEYQLTAGSPRVWEVPDQYLTWGMPHDEDRGGWFAKDCVIRLSRTYNGLIHAYLRQRVGEWVHTREPLCFIGVISDVPVGFEKDYHKVDLGLQSIRIGVVLSKENVILAKLVWN